MPLEPERLPDDGRTDETGAPAHAGLLSASKIRSPAPVKWTYEELRENSQVAVEWVGRRR